MNDAISAKTNEKEWRRRWDRSPILRAEFSNDIDVYLAYKRADDRGAIVRPDLERWLVIIEEHYSEERAVLEFAQRVLNKDRARASRERKEKAVARDMFDHAVKLLGKAPTARTLSSGLKGKEVSVPMPTLSRWLNEFKKAKT